MNAKEVRGWLDLADRRIVATLGRLGIPFLRISIGVVFVWFGTLKMVRASPVSELVAKTVYFFDPEWFVPVLGLVEVLIGAGLLARVALRLILLLFWSQILGTFLVLVLRPDVAFQGGNPLLLTVEGEFVIKNLVLLSAGMVIGSTVGRRSETVITAP